MKDEYFDGLTNALVPFAKEMLHKHGEFYPFGAFIDEQGKVEMVMADLGTEHPQSNDIIDLLIQGFRARAKDQNLQAVAYCADIALSLPDAPSERVDAIYLRLESPDGEARQGFIPYRKRRFLRKIEFGELNPEPAEAEIFGSEK